MRQPLVGLGAALTIFAELAAQQQRPAGLMLADFASPDAGKILTPATVVVLPLGAAAVQHGPHLRLNTDERLVRYLTGRVHTASSVVIAPSLTYHSYPTFLEHPGSTSLSHNTSRDTTVEIVRTLAKYGPRRFYVLTTGGTPQLPLKDAAEALAADGILLGYTDMRYHLGSARITGRQAAARDPYHADDAVTSMMLVVDPAAVDMSRAARDATGVVGDPTLATKERGQAYLEALVSGVLDDIESIRAARLPVARSSTAPAPPPRPQPQRPAEERMPNGCTATEERAIRAVGERFSYLWRQMDAEAIARLFSPDGDMRHPDGTIERSNVVIYQNRLELFRLRDYRGSVHPVQLNDIRCLQGGTAIADGKWELRFDQAPAAAAQRRGLGANKLHAGWCTLVLVRGEMNSWAIQAWRYTINPADGEQPPTTLKQPGFLPRRGGGGH